jgi:hypothetical protein
VFVTGRMRDRIPLIQEAARLFKDTAPVEDVELQGFVTRLARGPTETSGEVTLEGCSMANCDVPSSNWAKASTRRPCKPMSKGSALPARVTW